MNVSRIMMVSACGVSLTMAGLAVAQQAQPRANQPALAQPGQAAQRTQWKTTDQKLATCMAIANQEEVAIAKLAEEKAKNKDVKEFAQMLVKDHHKCLQKLQQYAPEASRDGFLNDNPATAAQQTREQQQAGKVQQAGGVNSARGIQQTAGVEADGQHLDFVQLHKEIAEECIRSARQEMSKKDDAEFDKCFIGFQIAKHAEMKTKLVVFERYATGDFKQIVAEGIEATEKHLKRAESIMKKLSDTGTSVSRRDRNDKDDEK